MPKLVVKPAINFFSTDTDAQLIIRVHGIIQALTGNADYPNPVPPLSLVSDAQHAFEAACANAALGGMLLTAIKNAKRGELVSLIRQLASYVTVACHGDLPTLLGSGFSIHKPTRDKIVRLPTPQTPVLRHGAQTGQIKAGTNRFEACSSITCKSRGLALRSRYCRLFKRREQQPLSRSSRWDRYIRYVAMLLEPPVQRIGVDRRP
jgi:hypothetical protein